MSKLLTISYCNDCLYCDPDAPACYKEEFEKEKEYPKSLPPQNGDGGGIPPEWCPLPDSARLTQAEAERKALREEVKVLRERNRELETQIEYQTGIGKMMRLHLDSNDEPEPYSNEYDLHSAFNLPSEL